MFRYALKLQKACTLCAVVLSKMSPDVRIYATGGVIDMAGPGVRHREGARAVAVLQLEGALPRLLVLCELVALLTELEHVAAVCLAHVQGPCARLRSTHKHVFSQIL